MTDKGNSQTKQPTQASIVQRNKLLRRQVRDYIIKMSGFIISVTYLAPLDRIQKLLQVQNVNSLIPPDQRYKGFMDCVYKVYRDQGLLSFWRGNLASITSSSFGLLLTMIFKNKLNKLNGSETFMADHKNLIRLMINGGISGVLSQLFVYPLYIVKTRLQTDVGTAPKNREFYNMNDCIDKLYQKEGLRTFYTGFSLFLLKNFIYKGIFFGLQDFYLNNKANRKEQISQIENFKVASIIVFITETTCYPLSLILNRLIVQQGKSDKLFSSILQCINWTMKNEGLIGFYRGILPLYVKTYNSSILVLLYNYYYQTQLPNRKLL
ncbi:adp atp translocase 2 [Stylonychia lemnae]|uniref:ADP/ATP translocase n=1 Tax=Stylonychia lemnae TaxID=5949 RepID=A0A078B0T9_STYLE|nr:adp atp translocase 2 [Stylonychia lemnae]|eukprot:CDW86972.1 adp atp translocase 2 [Stylonychia lemnae]